MNKNGEKASALAINLLEEQLRALPLSLASIDMQTHNGSRGPQLILKRKPRPAPTGSGGNIVADKAEHPDKAPEPRALELAVDTLHEYDDPMRVTVANAVLAIGAFLKAHDMLSMRTPEIQFLGHIVNAILNANRFVLDAGYMPTAAFDGLVITPELDGAPLFPNDGKPGFMELGDAVALLQWLTRYLRGERGYVSGGDAG